MLRHFRHGVAHAFTVLGSPVPKSTTLTLSFVRGLRLPRSASLRAPYGLANGSAGLFPPPALGERRHRGLARSRQHSLCASVSYVCHEMAVIRGRISSWPAKLPADHGGQIMKRLTRAKLFAEAKRARRDKDWFERAKLVVAAARDRAVETAQQRAPAMKRFPTVLQRRRLAERLAQYGA